MKATLGSMHTRRKTYSERYREDEVSGAKEYWVFSSFSFFEIVQIKRVLVHVHCAHKLSLTS
jgi:hypothetical protein